MVHPARTLAFLLVLAASASAASASGASGIGLGDLDASGRIDAADVSLLSRALRGVLVLDPAQRRVADVAPWVPGGPAGDGTLDVADLAVLARAAFGGDLDGDGLPGRLESRLGTSPFLPRSDGVTPDGSLDFDGDGLSNAAEAAAFTNPISADSDHDGLSDPWEIGFGLDPVGHSTGGDEDPDADGASNRLEQDLGTDPFDPDADLDGVLDGADFRCPHHTGNDEDGDGVCLASDNCPVTPNPSQADRDGDGVGDACDGCPDDPAPDPDRDGVCGAADNCPYWPNRSQQDRNGDGVGDSCTCGDLDGDGSRTAADLAQLDAALAGGFALHPERCDLDGDAICTASDREALAQALAGASVADGACGDHGAFARLFLGRIAYGADAWTLRRVEQLGVLGFAFEQLAPEEIPDLEIEAHLRPFVEGPYPSWNLSIAELRRRYCRWGSCPAWVSYQTRINDNLARIKLLRAIYSRRQLEALLLDFWLNHFNVDGRQRIAQWAMQSYEQDTIRPHVLGRFEDLLLAVTKSAAMLDYLDLRHDRAGAGNENYARELMEVHTVGPQGTYDEGDVQEVARILTGYTWTGDPDYEFRYDPLGHDNGTKTLALVDTEPWRFDGSLGCAGSPAEAFENEGHVLICLLAHHPKTAERLSRKLIQRFVDETPDPAFVERTARVWLDSDGDIATVLRSILTSGEFWHSLFFAEKVKRPHLQSASLIRATGRNAAGRSVAEDRYAFDAGMDALPAQGERLYEAKLPDGYPERSQPWVGVGAILVRINLAHRVLRSIPDPASHFGVPRDATAEEIVAQLAPRLAGGLRAADRARIAQMVAALPAETLPHERVREAAAAILATPRFVRH